MSSFSKNTAYHLIRENDGRCINQKCSRMGEELHHIFFKSQYHKTDRHGFWNGANLCQKCHKMVHLAFKNDFFTEGFKLDLYLKIRALNQRKRKSDELLLMINRSRLRLRDKGINHIDEYFVRKPKKSKIIY